MARIRQNLSCSDTRAELSEYKDARRGASEDAFWDEDELIDYRPSGKKKRKRRKGCEGNDGGPHVYVWISRPEEEEYSWFIRLRSTRRYEYKVCCGCEKRAHGKSFRVVQHTPTGGINENT